MLDVPTDRRADFKRWSDDTIDALGAGLDAEASMRVEISIIEFAQYFAGVIAERRRAPGKDLLSLLVDPANGETLSDGDLVSFAILLLVAGNETTTKLIGNTLLALQRHPVERAKVVADRGRIPDAVEEALRYEGSTQVMARTLTRDAELHGVTMREGAKVLLLLGSANRDERVWDRPDVFDIDRVGTTHHVGFGHGIHVCLGAALARLEMRVSLEELLARAPGYEIDESGLTRVHSGNVRGYSSMPMLVG